MSGEAYDIDFSRDYALALTVKPTDSQLQLESLSADTEPPSIPPRRSTVQLRSASDFYRFDVAGQSRNLRKDYDEVTGPPVHRSTRKPGRFWGSSNANKWRRQRQLPKETPSKDEDGLPTHSRDLLFGSERRIARLYSLTTSVSGPKMTVQHGVVSTELKDKEAHVVKLEGRILRGKHILDAAGTDSPKDVFSADLRCGEISAIDLSDVQKSEDGHSEPAFANLVNLRAAETLITLSAVNYNFPNLVRLDLSSCELSSLPQDVQLLHLQVFDVSYNNLNGDDWLHLLSFPSLIVLQFKGNRIGRLRSSEELSHLFEKSRIAILDVSDNHLEDDSFRSVASLPWLSTLQADNNKVKMRRPLAPLGKKMVELSLKGNQIIEPMAPVWLMKAMPNLTVLKMEENPLSLSPAPTAAEMSSELGTYIQLKSRRWKEWEETILDIFQVDCSVVGSRNEPIGSYGNGVFRSKTGSAYYDLILSQRPLSGHPANTVGEASDEASFTTLSASGGPHRGRGAAKAPQDSDIDRGTFNTSAVSFDNSRTSGRVGTSVLSREAYAMLLGTTVKPVGRNLKHLRSSMNALRFALVPRATDGPVEPATPDDDDYLSSRGPPSPHPHPQSFVAPPSVVEKANVELDRLRDDVIISGGDDLRSLHER